MIIIRHNLLEKGNGGKNKADTIVIIISYRLKYIKF